jgi:hypothetical protein
MMGTSLGRPAQASLIVARTLQIDPHPFLLDTCRKRKRVSADHVSAKTTVIPNLARYACAHPRPHPGSLCLETDRATRSSRVFQVAWCNSLPLIKQ